jgi:AcrR family transcriptional regulator
MEAAQDFLRESSFREMSVDALMTRTGHTRTVFYRHFDDIPALVLALIEEVGTELVSVAEEWAGTGSVGPEEARRRLGVFVDFYVRNGPLVHAVVEAAYNGMVDGFITLTSGAVQERIDSGELAPLDAPEISRALVRMLNGYLEDSLGRDRGADPDRVLETVTTIWTRTLFPNATDA